MVIAAAAATTVVAIAVNLATSADLPWLAVFKKNLLWWVVGSTAAVAVTAFVVVQVQRFADRRIDELLPAEQRLEPWIVDRPDEVRQVVNALLRRPRATVGITTAVHGAGGFGKTTVAKLVRADRRVLRQFGGRVYWVTLGRDVRARSAIADKVNDLIARLDPQSPMSFTDPQQAGQYLASLLSTGPPRLIILDDVWHVEQELAFPVGGRCVRLITTRIPSLVGGESIPVPVDQVTQDQARLLLTAGMPALPSAVVRDLVAETGRWPLLLRLVNKVLSDQVTMHADAAAAARSLVDRLRRSGALQVDGLSGASVQRLDVNDPDQRRHAIAATIEASAGLLAPVERARFAELAVFAEDETVPVALVQKLWQETGGLDIVRTRALCARLAQLALLTVTGVDDDGAVSLHDVVRDYLQEELGSERLVELHRSLLRAVADGIPVAIPFAHRASDSSCGGRIAWWQMAESARYLWDHLVEHLVAGQYPTSAEALVVDLRWVLARVEQSGPIAPYIDLSLVDTRRCARLHRLLGQTAHLLAPTSPARFRADILFSRVAHDPEWGPQASELAQGRTAPALVNRWPLPDLPDPALLRTLTAHTKMVRALAVSPDGSRIASASDDNTMRIWDTASEKELAAAHHQSSSISILVAGPDGSWFASANDAHVVQIWDAITAEERSSFTGHELPVRALVAAPDGSWLASAGDDRQIRIWDTITTTARCVLDGHRDAIQCLAVAPDGSWLASASADQTVRVWDTSTGRDRFTLAEHTGTVHALAVAPDGSWLASASADHTVRVWDTSTGRNRRILAGHTRAVRLLMAAPDGSWLASAADDHSVRVWTMETGEERATHTPRGPLAAGFAVSPDGRWLASSSYSGTIVVWDTASGKPLATLTAHTDVVRALVAPSRTGLVSAGDDNTVRTWDLSSLERRSRNNARTRSVNLLAVSPDGKWLASAGDDNMIRTWDTATSERRFTYTDSVYSLMNEETYSLMREEAYPWMREEEYPWMREGEYPWMYEEAKALTIAPNGRWLALALDDRNIRLWRTLADNVPARWFTGPSTMDTGFTTFLSNAEALAVTPDGRTLVCAGDGDYKIRLWNVNVKRGPYNPLDDDGPPPEIARREFGPYRFMGHTDTVRALAIAPDGTWIASAGDDMTILFWDMQDGRNLAAVKGHARPVRTLAVAPDGTWLVSAGDDQDIRLWDVGTRRQISTLVGHTQPVRALAVAPDGHWLASVSDDQTVRIWDIANREVAALLRIEEPASACAWTPDGQSIAVAGRAGLYLFDFVTGTTF
ncbi:NB-ARC domain-containing protein [Amycolatopsis coloradensis]|uniref:NB-ARC domain-containing protein n=1 Tax=Amycolatopsis coloradensis TaxID=76021 RepID=UPI0013013550|nr:NB-ARC domain-containing protein [Amycolatopsis coloradensis]